MRVFNQDKNRELTQYDLDRGYLKEDKLFVKHHEAVEFTPAVGHYHAYIDEEGITNLRWVVDTLSVPACEAYDEYEDILIYIPYSEKEYAEHILEHLRMHRETECFPIINRGAPWYNRLTAGQKAELDTWYQSWLDVTETKVIPEKPQWVE